jgi:transcriptional regulator NrdR family protein
VELSGSLVVATNNGHISPFSRDKLYLSIWSALGHRNDAVSAASALTATIIASLRKTAVTPRLDYIEIIKTATAVLRRFDIAASIQYSAYHKL